MMGCKSLYWGDTSYSKDFSSQDIHNVKTSRSLEETLLWCEEAITNPQKYKYVSNRLSTNIFAEIPSTDEITKFIGMWSKLILCWRDAH